jgi:hypothetical protein
MASMYNVSSPPFQEDPAVAGQTAEFPQGVEGQERGLRKRKFLLAAAGMVAVQIALFGKGSVLMFHCFSKPYIHRALTPYPSRM